MLVFLLPRRIARAPRCCLPPAGPLARLASSTRPTILGSFHLSRLFWPQDKDPQHEYLLPVYEMTFDKGYKFTNQDGVTWDVPDQAQAFSNPKLISVANSAFVESYQQVSPAGGASAPVSRDLSGCCCWPVRESLGRTCPSNVVQSGPPPPHLPPRACLSLRSGSLPRAPASASALACRAATKARLAWA